MTENANKSSLSEIMRIIASKMDRPRTAAEIAKMVIRAVRLRQIELEQETTQKPARADRMRFDETLD